MSSYLQFLNDPRLVSHPKVWRNHLLTDTVGLVQVRDHCNSLIISCELTRISCCRDIKNNPKRTSCKYLVEENETTSQKHWCNQVGTFKLFLNYLHFLNDSRLVSHCKAWRNHIHTDTVCGLVQIRDHCNLHVISHKLSCITYEEIKRTMSKEPYVSAFIKTVYWEDLLVTLSRWL